MKYFHVLPLNLSLKVVLTFDSVQTIDTSYCLLPLQGELTPFNLPMYLAHKKPLLIVFRADSEESVITPVMTKLARDKAFPSVFLCSMPV